MLEGPTVSVLPVSKMSVDLAQDSSDYNIETTRNDITSKSKFNVNRVM